MKRRLFSGLMALFMVLTLIPGPVPAYAAEVETISGGAMEAEKAAAAEAIRAANAESLTPLEETQSQDAEEAALPNTPSETEEAAPADTPSDAEEAALPDTPSDAEEAALPDTPSETEEAALPDTPSETEEAALPDTPSETEEAALPGVLFDPEEESLPDEASDESDDIAQILAVEFKLIFGDVNGDGAINQTDADLLSSAVSNTVTLTDAQKAAANVDGEGEVDWRDALALKQYVDQTIDVLPVFEVKKLAAQGYCGREGVNVMWTLDNDGILTVSGVGAMCDSPSWKDVRTGTSYKSQIKGVVIESGVTSIGEYAFQSCAALETLSIDGSVKSVGYRAFYGCLQLTNVVIPEGVTTIGGAAFYGCRYLESMSLPSTLTSISSEAFSYCGEYVEDGFTLIVPRDSYARTYAGSYGRQHAFADNPTAVMLRSGSCGDKLAWMIYKSDPATLVLEGSGAMNNWSSGGAPWYSSRSSITTVTVPKGVTSIGSYAFYEFSKLTTIAIPDAVTSIGQYAFYKCAALKALTIPATVTSIGSYVFTNCSELTLTVSRDSYGRTYAGANRIRHVLADDTGDPKAVILASGACGDKLWWSIYASAPATLVFEGSGAMTSWSYSDNVPWYSSRATITAVTIPKGVTSIGGYAFYEFSKLATITIPDTVTSIGNYAFNKCTALKTLTIPATVTSIGSYVFANCPDLTLTVSRDSVGRTYAGNNAIRHALADDPKTFILRSGMCGDKLWWTVYESDPATLVLEGSGAMSNWNYSDNVPWYSYRASITAVTIPKGVTSIGQYAFNEFSKLATVSIPDTVTTIGSYAFNKCAALKAFTIPDSVTSIGNYAFSNCPELTLTVSRDSYGRTYAGSNSIRHVLDDDPTAAITKGGKCGEKLWWAIYESDPATLVLEGSGAMTSWNYSDSMPWYSYRASITAITIPKGVTSIGQYAFNDFSKLTTITIPDTVTSIGSYAFNKCAALKALTIPATVTSIGSGAFNNCPELTLTVSRDSYGRTYAGNNGLRHVLADASNSPILKGGQCGETLWWAIYQSAPTTLVFEGSGDMNNWGNSSSNSAPWVSYKSTLTAVTIPKGVTSIGNYAFYEFSKLTTIAIPDSVASIGSYAFYKCAALTTLTISANVTTIGDYAFSNCENLLLTVPRESQARIYAGSRGLRHVFADDPKAVLTRGGQCGDKLWWAIYESAPATLVLEGSGAMSDYDYNTGAPWKSYKGQFTAVTIPAGVTSIGKYAFYEFTKLTSVTIPANVTSIGASAFGGCSALEALTIPATVASIGEYVFSNCGKLTLTVFRDTPGMTYAINAGIPHKVEGESRKVVADGKCGANLYWVLLGDGTLEMTGDGDMYDYGTDYSGNPNMPWASLRAQIKAVSIPAGVTRVGNYAFYGCAALTKATLPASVDSIGQRAFMDCAALTEVTTSASKIESRAFYNCAALSKVTLADGLKTIGDEAFSNCTALSALSIPQSVTSIGKSVFSGCEKLKLTVPPDSYVRTFAIANGFPHYVSNAPKLLIEACGTCGSTLQWLFYENGTLSFEGSGAMYDYKADSSQNYRTTAPWYPYSQRITAVNFSDQMSRVGNYAFYGDTYYSNDNRFTKLTALTLPASVTSIGDYAFYHCAELKTLNLPNGALSIGKNAFDGCSALTSVILPKTLESIGASAFANCGALVLTVYTGSYAKDYVMKNGLKYVTSDNPDSLVLDSGSCGDKLYWEFYADGTLKFEGSGAMNDYSNGWSERYGWSDKKSYTNAPWYEYRAQITKVVIPEGVTRIGNCAFYGQMEYATDYRFTALESVTLPASLTAIGHFAFYGCIKLKDFTFPDALGDIGQYAFNSCDGLKDLTIPKDLKSIGANAFGSCPNLTLTVYSGSYAASYVLQNNVRHKVFGSSDPVTVASGKCGQNLSWMLYDNGILKFQGSGAMSDYSRHSDSEPRTTAPWYVNKDQIVEVIIPEGVTKIGSYAFYGSTYYATDWRFTALKKVTLPASLESIGSYAFYGCVNLETPALPAKLGSVGSYAFAECAALTKLTVPQNLNSIGQGAFADCPQLLLSVLKDSYGRTYALQNGLRHATQENPDAIVAGSGFADSNSKLYWLFYEDGRLVFEGAGAIKDYSVNSHHTSAPWYKYSDQITSITIPDTVTGIGAYAFYGSIYYGQDSRFVKVSGIDIPDSVTSIGSSAFQNCTGLTSLTLSPYVGKIGSNAFAGCQNLTLRIYKDTDARMYAVRNGLKHTIIETKRTALISGECGDSWSSSTIYWLLYTDGKLEFEGSGAMRNFTGNNYTTNAPWQPYRNQITSVVIPDGVTSIGSYAFYGIQYYSKDYRFSSLSSITIPESVNNIGEYAFSGCAALQSLTLPDKLTSISKGLFSGCSSLYGLTMLEGMKSIGSEAFSGCASLSLLLIPESVTSIGKNAFAKCRALTLQVHEGSYALTYAQEQNLRHEIYESGVVVPGTPPDVDDPTVAPVTPVSPAQPFDVTRDAYAFVNEAKSFGYTGSLKGSDYPIAYNPPFQMIFGDSVAGKSKWKQTTMGQWGGNCNGFSSTAALMYAGIIAAASSGKETVSALGVNDKLSEDFDVKTFIEAMQVSQYTDSFAKDYQGNKRTAKQLKESGLSLNNLIETVAADVAKGKCDIIAVGKQGVGAHALLAYRMEQVSATEYKMYVYDCNFPGETRTFKLTADNDAFTHWTYNMGSYGDWGTEGSNGSLCFISFIPFDTIRYIWDNRGSMYQSKEMLSVNVANLSIVDSSNKEVARLEDGNLVTDSAEIFEVPELSMTWSDTNSIYLPKDLYTIRATDDSQELQASMTDRNLEASVTTSSNAVTFAVDDASRENTVFIDGMSETDTYDVKLSSSFIDSEYETLSISGTGSEGMTSDTISISGAKDSLALSSNITYTTLKINETEQQAQYYTIQASVNDKDGGSIAPSGDVKVLPGASQSFTFVPKVGYKFDYIEVDGVKLENLTISGTYTFTLAEEDTDRAITAYFSKAYEIGEAAFDPASRTVNVTNLLSLTDAVLTAMAFDGNGKFVACATKDVKADATDASVTFATELPENCSVKLVLTDKDMKPLCSPFPVQSA